MLLITDDITISKQMIRQVKQSNSSKLDDFSNILLNQFERFKPFFNKKESLPGSEFSKHESPRSK